MTSACGGGSVQVETAYPFDDEVKIIARASTRVCPLYIRVPDWAGGDGGTAELLIESNGSRPVNLDGKNGTVVRVGMVPAGATPLRATLLLKPRIRIERWSAGGYSVHRGALMFSLPIAPNFTVVAHHYGTDAQSNDYDVSNASAWAYALDASPTDPSATMEFVPSGTMDPAAAPFNHTGWPVAVRATIRSLPDWGISINSADSPPASPACASPGTCGAPQRVLLVPHGATDLRIGMFPLA